MIVDIVSDVVCPWCFVGRRKLAAAAARWQAEAGEALTIRWHPFELNPDLPADGIARADYVARKFGPRAAEVYGRVTSVGKGIGIDFAFDRIARQPNTRKAHQLIAAAAVEGVQDAVAEALFRAYFLEGEDLTDDERLVAVAVAAGMSAAVAREAIGDRGLAEQVTASETRAQEMGISGVPFFIFGGRVAVSGAQDPEVLVEAMRNAREAATGTAE